MSDLEAIQFLSNFDTEFRTSTNNVLVHESLKILNRLVCK